MDTHICTDVHTKHTQKLKHTRSDGKLSILIIQQIKLILFQVSSKLVNYFFIIN